MSVPASPREVFERHLDALAGRNWTEFVDQYADDAVVEIPFAVTTPRRLAGRAEIQAHLDRAAGSPLVLRPANIVVYTTGDPEMIIAEFDYHVTITTTGQTFTVPNIQVFRVRAGKIVSTRDYHDHVSLAAALGQLPALVSAATAA